MKKKKIPSNSYYKSLMKSMLLIGVIVPFMPMLLVSGIIYYQLHTSYNYKVHTHLGELIERSRINVEGYLNERVGDVRFLLNSFSIEELNEDSFLIEILKKLALRNGNNFMALELFNGEGVQIAYAGPENLRSIQSIQKQRGRALKSDVGTIRDLQAGPERSPSIAIELRQQSMEKPWFLRAIINPESLSKLMNVVSTGEDGFAYIMNRNGQYITRPPDKNNPAGVILRKSKQIKHGSNGGISIFINTDLSGSRNIYSSIPFNNGRWILVHQQKVSDAFSGLKKAKTVAVIAFLVVCALILVNAYSLSKKMVFKIAIADKQKEKMNEKMFQTGKLAAIGELAAGIAHEINNPVAIMVEEAGWIDDLLEEEEFGESKNLSEFKRALKQIRTQGRRCKEITHKLLSFARKSDSRVEEVALHDFIEDIISISSKKAKLDGVFIEKDIQKDLPPVAVSPTELQQVILNLINNALDAMEEKGGLIKITAKATEDSILIEVSDNGPGIPAENISKIFDPFFTTKPVGKGTGLGLSICYGIIKKLGGEINVRSTVGEGSTFRIRIPLIRLDKGSVKIPKNFEESFEKKETLIDKE
ncbi:ATP-binding protein [Thermodesulfobacteriota bacterium]